MRRSSKTYSPEFLDRPQGQSCATSIPDLYLKGQGEYFDELRVNIAAADAGTKTAKQALDDTAAAWERITRRMGAAQPGRAMGVPEVDLSRERAQVLR